MPIVGLGTDLARVERFRTFVTENKAALLGRLFTPGERAYALAKKDPAPHLAARFAAKEACLKA
jgi:holo-[acyl-carrier protein] synthase